MTAALANLPTGPCLDCGDTDPGAPICHHCGHPMGVPAKVDYFQALGLPSRFLLEESRVHDAFHAANKALHPDRFVGKSLEEQKCALAWASLANSAYREIKDRTRRAEYLLELMGAQLPEEEKKRVPSKFVEEYFDLQEALAEADPQQLKQAHQEWSAKREALDGELEPLMRQADAALDRGQPEACSLLSIAHRLHERSYVSALLRDLERRMSGVQN